MGDMGDDFRAFREYKKEQKNLRHQKNLDLLAKSGFDYQSKDMFDTHFHVMLTSGEVVSFWPSSGAWRRHSSNAKTMYGWQSLNAFARKKKDTQ